MRHDLFIHKIFPKQVCPQLFWPHFCHYGQKLICLEIILQCFLAIFETVMSKIKTCFNIVTHKNIKFLIWYIIRSIFLRRYLSKRYFTIDNKCTHYFDPCKEYKILPKPRIFNPSPFLNNSILESDQ